MTKTMHGVIQGKTIVLAEDPGLADGEQVEMLVRRVSPQADRQPGEGFLRTEGALADDPYWDTIMDEVHQARKHERRPEWNGG